MTDNSTSAARLTPIQPGEPAPEFRLAAVNHEGTISLAEYRGRSPLFLALFVGLWCPFCRRSIAQMGTMEGRIRAAGVETLGVVASAPDNARLYFKYRPTRLRLAADPELFTHRAYGVPKPEVTPELMDQVASIRINPHGDLPEALPPQEAALAIERLDGGHTPTETDQADLQRQWPQLKGQFLIDRDGVVRWTNIECGGPDGLAGLGKFPTVDEILAAIRTLPA
ncbi:MAG TPA: redoxin domain-containing protein [Methylomirabilota bacterium]|jgi:peroxiredoxin